MCVRVKKCSLLLVQQLLCGNPEPSLSTRPVHNNNNNCSNNHIKNVVVSMFLSIILYIPYYNVAVSMSFCMIPMFPKPYVTP